MIKLKSILNEFLDDPKLTPEQRNEILEMIAKYNEYGKHLYDEISCLEIAKELGNLVEGVEKLIAEESGDWFDRITIRRNLKELRGHVKEFYKLAKHVHGLKEQLCARYEEAGHILSRYFEIQDLEEPDEEKELKQEACPPKKVKLKRPPLRACKK